jgi:polysaccharide biosynthesis transport protein
MTPSPASTEHEQATLGTYLATLRRRKWVVLQALVLVPLSALLFSLSQEKLYEAQSEVLISRQNLAAALTGTTDPLATQQADRLLQTQASLARTPEVAGRVLEEVPAPEHDVQSFFDATSVTARTNADLLVFRVEDPDPARAQDLATAYARQFTLYRRELDTGALEQARGEVAAQLRELERAGERRGDLYGQLADKEQQLRMLEVLQTSNASVVREGEAAEQIQPRPLRNVVLGLMLGLLLGVGLAFLWEALDTRLRRADDISRELHLPLLARLPVPPRKLRSNDRLVMLAEPTGVQAEAFRVLRTNLEFASLDQDVRTLMVTSGVEGEGKSTTAANLAVALARAGKRVTLVDLDLRRPFLHRFFDLEGRPGLTNVALGRATLAEALTPVAFADGERPADGGAQNGHGPSTGVLFVLGTGPLPPDPGEFIGSAAVARILKSLGDGADVVVIDSPPLLRVGDGLSLSKRVDAVVIVARLGVVRRDLAREVRRVLQSVPAQKLGFVITGQGAESGYGYGYGYGYEQQREPRGRRKREVSA